MLGNSEKNEPLEKKEKKQRKEKGRQFLQMDFYRVEEGENWGDRPGGKEGVEVVSPEGKLGGKKNGGLGQKKTSKE